MIKIHPHPLQRCANLLTQLPTDRSSNPNNWLNCFGGTAAEPSLLSKRKLINWLAAAALHLWRTLLPALPMYTLCHPGVRSLRNPWRLAFSEKLHITNQFPGATLWHLLRSIPCLRKRPLAPKLPAAPVNGLSLSQQRRSVARSNCDRKLNIPPAPVAPVLAPPFAFKHFCAVECQSTAWIAFDCERQLLSCLEKQPSFCSCHWSGGGQKRSLQCWVSW
jgi:hypothetical protein